MKIIRLLPCVLLLAACSTVTPDTQNAPEPDTPSLGMPVIDENGNPSSVGEMIVTEDAGGDGDAMSAPGAAAGTRVIEE